MAVTLAACVQTGSTDFTPKPVETISATPTAPTTAPATTAPTTPSESPTASATSQTPSATPTDAGVKASGTMSIYGEISKALKGTCRAADGGPTITMTDKANEFYGRVDAVVVLDTSRKSVVDVRASFEEDSEGFAWELTYASAKPVAGTSASVTSSGNTYTISGKVQSKETRKGKTRTEVLPFKIVAKCASSDW